MDNTQNFVTGSVVAAPSPATSGTSVTVSNGSLFPDPTSFGAYNLCLWSQAGDPTPTTCEIVRVTAKTTSGSNAVLTITRAQEGTSGLSVATGWKAYYSLTQKYFDDLETALAGKQDTLTAGSHISIVSSTISATYSNFTGTDGVDAGAAGLVPAPATTDADKFLNADGTWSGAIPTYSVGSTEWDTEPTSASTKAVTSGGVYTALNQSAASITFKNTTPSPNTDTQLPFNTLTSLRGSDFSLDVSDNLVCGVAGIVQISANISPSQSGNGLIYVYQNGSKIFNTNFVTGGVNYYSVSLPAIFVSVSANDTLSIYTRVSAGTINGDQSVNRCFVRYI